MDKSCHVEPRESYADFSELSADYTAYFRIEGMGCQNCANRVKNGLLALQGVHMAEVSLQEGVAGVVYNPDLHSPPALENAIFNAGNDGRHLYYARLSRVLDSPTILNSWE